MKILHVLSQYEVNGAETYAATLADECIRQGDSVSIVSDTFHTPTQANVVQYPIGNRSYMQRFRNIIFLHKYIEQHGIDVVHAHSRAASWVSYFATRQARVPLVSSIHMRQHLHASSKLYSVYGEKLIAVCKAIYDHLRDEMHFPEDKLVVIPNGIDLSQWRFQPKSNHDGKKYVAVVGRFTGFKGDALVSFLNRVVSDLYKEYPEVEFHIVGGMSNKEKIGNIVKSINDQLGEHCLFLDGFTTEVERVYHRADVVVGAGRVAMEALACGSPVVAMGESEVVGLITEKTAERALYSNFGDLSPHVPFDSEKCIDALLSLLRKPEIFSPQWGRRFIEEQYDIRIIAQRIRKLYESFI